MTEKYTDLAEEIWRADEGYTSLGSVEMVLDYLDQHPDQVPGRTITRSTMHELISEHFYTPVREIDVEAYTEALGRLVAPDPEPTNAEKINEAYAVWDREPQNFTFGEYLDRLGWVKAQGGDDA